MTKGDKLEMIEDNGHDAMGKVQRCIKRGFDLVAAFAGIVVCSPVFLIISLLITYQGNGPVFFRQIRIGYKGRPFAIFKFRSYGMCCAVICRSSDRAQSASSSSTKSWNRPTATVSST